MNSRDAILNLKNMGRDENEEEEEEESDARHSKWQDSGIKWRRNIYISDAILNLEDMGHDERWGAGVEYHFQKNQ